MDNRGEEMDDIRKLGCYILLGVVFIFSVVCMGSICRTQKKQDEEWNVRIEELRELKEEALKQQQNLIEDERVVLVKNLPVYAKDDISINKEAKPKVELPKGEIVILEEEGTSYSLVRNVEGTISGYVWNDCIGEKSEKQSATSRVIVIDAGHQGKGDNKEEPVGPGAKETKARVSSGTSGISTKRYEHETVLDVALELEEELESRGYLVIQVRRDADVKISNSERAVLANQIEADILIRLHANGADDNSVKGADVFCISKDNPYVKTDIYDECKSLAECVLDAYTEVNPKIKKNKIRESDEYTGLNWCEVPSIILEMGYMTNEEDDEYLNDDKNLRYIAKGIANGIDEYFDDMGDVE